MRRKNDNKTAAVIFFSTIAFAIVILAISIIKTNIYNSTEHKSVFSFF